MRVRIFESLAGNFAGGKFVLGSGEHDVSPSLGKYLVDKGLAAAVEEEKPKVKPVRVQEVKAETRPVRKKKV